MSSKTLPPCKRCLKPPIIRRSTKENNKDLTEVEPFGVSIVCYCGGLHTAFGVSTRGKDKSTAMRRARNMWRFFMT